MHQNYEKLKTYFDHDYAKDGIYRHIEGFTRLIQQNLKPGIVVCELGCFTGDTTIINLPIVKAAGGKYIVVDWFLGNDESKAGIDHSNLFHENSGRHHFREGYDEIVFPKFLENIKTTGCEDILEVHKGKTSDCSLNIPDKSLDICFIDAAHDYDNVYSDIKLYWNKVKDGGILCGHDYDGCHPDVVRAVHELIGTPEVYHCYNGMGNVWIKRL